MGTWNYRIVRRAMPGNMQKTWGEYHYGLHEVHYDDEGNPVARGEPLAGFGGDDPSEVVAGLERAIRDAKERPVLNEWDIRGLEHTAPQKGGEA